MIAAGALHNTAVFSEELSNRREDGAVSPADVADYWGVHVNTIYRDIKKGALPVVRLPSGRIRIRREEARRYGRPHE